MKGIIVNCNKCKKDFYFKMKNIKKKIIDKTKVEYFICKHCQEKYITMCTDDYVRDKKDELRDIENKITNLANQFALSREEEILKELDKTILKKDKLKNELKDYIDTLKREIKDRI